MLLSQRSYNEDSNLDCSDAFVYIEKWIGNNQLGREELNAKNKDREIKTSEKKSFEWNNIESKIRRHRYRNPIQEFREHEKLQHSFLGIN